MATMEQKNDGTKCMIECKLKSDKKKLQLKGMRYHRLQKMEQDPETTPRSHKK